MLQLFDFIKVCVRTGQYKMQNADCRRSTKCKLISKCRLTRKTVLFFVRNVVKFKFIECVHCHAKNKIKM